MLGGAPLPVVVSLSDATAGEHTVTLQLPGESSFLSSLSQTTLQLINGATRTVWLTALQPSVAEDDVQLEAFVDGDTAIAGDGHLTNEQVTFEKDIKNEDTPEGMKDRIPPRTITPTTVTLNVTLTKGQAVTLVVAGSSKTAGEAEFREGTGMSGIINLTQAGANDVSLVGTDQTTPTADGKGATPANSTCTPM